MRIISEDILAKAHAIVYSAEVANRWEIQGLKQVAARPYQRQELRIPNKVLRENREVFTGVIRQLTGLGVVEAIQAV